MNPGKPMVATFVAALLLSLLPTATADIASTVAEQYSCSVSTEGPTQCTFSCTGRKPIGGSLDVAEGEAAISGSCGGGSFGCAAKDDCSTADEAVVSAANGICEIASRTAGEDTATGSCYGTAPDKPAPPSGTDCDIEIDPLGLCVNLPPAEDALASHGRLIRPEDAAGATTGGVALLA